MDAKRLINPPRLIIKAVDADVPGSKFIALCTEDGAVFGRPVSCSVSSEAEALSMVTATFYIDGDAIRFAD